MWQIAGAMVLAALAVPAWAESVPTDEQLRFIAANAQFTLLHEMGHLLINELQLPVLGREEDAADQLGLIGLFLRHDRHKDPDFYQQLVDVAEYWRLEWLLPKPDHEEIQPWDSHALDAQRFYNISCLIYGSDPDSLEWVIEATGLPAERALYCDEEFRQARHAVEWFEEHFRRSPSLPMRHRITVQYDPPPAELSNGQEMLRKIRDSGELEAVAQLASETFDLPRDGLLRLTACSAPDSWYDARNAEIVLCYERLEHFLLLYRLLDKIPPGPTSKLLQPEP
ncbi:DUF4344 domain-containing metallopeptidase [Ectopseudomonas hydrolytica]|uniref:DUF4344 domain-containing metallopeptidase n=1 Tax=Ectopseudomonas hydrolytica TaxID=2493633 RepID=UPI003EDF7879